MREISNSIKVGKNVEDAIRRAFQRQQFAEAFRATFAELTEEERNTLLALSVRTTYGKDEVIIAEGSREEGIYIVADGEVRITRRNIRSASNEYIEIARAGIGAVLGEMSFLEQNGASASIVANGTVELFHIEGKNIRRIMNDDLGFSSRFFMSLALALSRRLRLTNTRIDWQRPN